MKKTCNICGGKSFAGGPNNRMSQNGTPPRCETCQSLERHRVARSALSQMRTDKFLEMDVLQFSMDRCVEDDWFKSRFVSVYGTETSLDLQKIDRETGQYDLLICNHVIEHVKYDNAALNEMCRVIKDDGLVFLTFPDPANVKETSDWDYPKEEKHGHYRIYGEDVVDRFLAYIPHRWVLSEIIADPVTGVDDQVFFLTKSSAGSFAVLEKFPNATVINRPDYKLIS